MKIESVSDTALWVATFRARESKRSDALFHDDLAEKLIGEKGPAIARDMGYEGVMEWLLTMRTVAIDQLILDKISEIDLVLNIGAGLDTRPYRLPLPPSLIWVEADFPAIIDYKNTILANEKPKCQLERVIVDLGDRTKAMEFYASIAKRAPRVLVITEGVLVYLEEAAVSQLMTDLHSFESFRYWILDYSNTLHQRRSPRAWVKKLGKNYFKFQTKSWKDFFAKRGWRESRNIITWDLSAAHNRWPKLNLFWTVLMMLTPTKKRRETMMNSGYALYERV